MPLSLYTLFSLFNRLSPKETGSRTVATGIAYGAGPRRMLDIYAPSRGTGPWPVIFFCYGGSWSEGDRSNYAFAGRALSALGYVTVVADHRLVPEVEYPHFLDDLTEAFAWMVGNVAGYGGDPGKVALMGHSAGAYNAVMLALDSRYLRARGLLGSVKAFVGLSGPYDFFPFDGPISIRVFGAVPDPHSTQPVNLVTADAPPMFLGHGEKDPIVWPYHVIVLAARLRGFGIASVEKVYPRLGHAHPLTSLGMLLRWQAPVLRDVAAFLRQYLR